MREELLTAEKERIRAKKEIRRFFLRLAGFALLCWVLFGVVFGLTVVPDAAMEPALCAGDLILFDRLEKDAAAGETVVYRQNGTLHLGRVAARGGDTVEVTDAGDLILNGRTVAEAQSTRPFTGGPDYPLTLAQDEVFLLCDDRTAGPDSRLYGAVPTQQVAGRVLAAVRRSGL